MCSEDLRQGYSKERRYGLWAKAECDNCQQEFQVTRTSEKVVPAGGYVVCNDCEMFQRGYDEGVNYLEAKSREEVADAVETKAIIEELVEGMVDMWLDDSIQMTHHVTQDDISRYRAFIKKMKEGTE